MLGPCGSERLPLQVFHMPSTEAKCMNLPEPISPGAVHITDDMHLACSVVIHKSFKACREVSKLHSP